MWFNEFVDLPPTVYPKAADCVFDSTARNRYGFELAPAPRIPWWPIAIVGALVFAGMVGMCRR
jgi:hypothetical protein